MKTLLKAMLVLSVLLGLSSQAMAVGLVWGEGNWGDDWAAAIVEPVDPPEGPLPEAVRLTSIGGDAREADIRLGAYSSTGEPAYGNDFTSGDFVTILGQITPDPVDVGVNGELFAAMLSVVAGQANFSFLNSDGSFEAWDLTLPGLGAAAVASPLEESHELTVFEGSLQAGVHKITFAYQAEGGPLVYMKPVTIRVTD